MKLCSEAWSNGEPIPERFAVGRLLDRGVGLSDNLSPPLAWSDPPAGTRSLVLICNDFDVPGETADLNRPDRELPVDLPRVDFFHWVLVDIPATARGFVQGQWSKGFGPGRKPAPTTAGGVNGPRQGLNDYTSWFAGDAGRAGDYFGYDGPFPPFNDMLVHHYVFTLYALSAARLAVEGRFNGLQVRQALADQVLDAATLSGTYTLNRRLRAA